MNDDYFSRHDQKAAVDEKAFLRIVNEDLKLFKGTKGTNNKPDGFLSRVFWAILAETGATGNTITMKQVHDECLRLAYYNHIYYEPFSFSLGPLPTLHACTREYYHKLFIPGNADWHTVDHQVISWLLPNIDAHAEPSSASSRHEASPTRWIVFLVGDRDVGKTHAMTVLDEQGVLPLEYFINLDGRAIRRECERSKRCDAHLARRWQSLKNAGGEREVTREYCDNICDITLVEAAANRSFHVMRVTTYGEGDRFMERLKEMRRYVRKLTRRNGSSSSSSSTTNFTALEDSFRFACIHVMPKMSSVTKGNANPDTTNGDRGSKREDKIKTLDDVRKKRATTEQWFMRTSMERISFRDSSSSRPNSTTNGKSAEDGADEDEPLLHLNAVLETCKNDTAPRLRCVHNNMGGWHRGLGRFLADDIEEADALPFPRGLSTVYTLPTRLEEEFELLTEEEAPPPTPKPATDHHKRQKMTKSAASSHVVSPLSLSGAPSRETSTNGVPTITPPPPFAKSLSFSENMLEDNNEIIASSSSSSSSTSSSSATDHHKRVVVTVAVPKSNALPAAQSEAETVKRVLNASPRANGPNFSVVQLDSQVNLEEELNEAFAWHVIAHMADHTHHDAARGSLMLVDEDNNPAPVEQTALLDAVVSTLHTLKLVVLNGCDSQALAKALLGAGVERVVYWTSSVPDAAGSLFAQGFWSGYVKHGGNAKLAYRDGRLKVEQAKWEAEGPCASAFRFALDIAPYTSETFCVLGLSKDGREEEESSMFDETWDPEYVTLWRVVMGHARIGWSFALDDCMRKQPKRRPTSEEINKHPYLASCYVFDAHIFLRTLKEEKAKDPASNYVPRLAGGEVVLGEPPSVTEVHPLRLKRKGQGVETAAHFFSSPRNVLTLDPLSRERAAISPDAKRYCFLHPRVWTLDCDGTESNRETVRRVQEMLPRGAFVYFDGKNRICGVNALRSRKNLEDLAAVGFYGVLNFHKRVPLTKATVEALHHARRFVEIEPEGGAEGTSSSSSSSSVNSPDHDHHHLFAGAKYVAWILPNEIVGDTKNQPHGSLAFLLRPPYEPGAADGGCIFPVRGRKC